MKTREFHQVKDYKKIFGAAALGYVPYLALLANQGGTAAVSFQLGIIAAFSAAIQVPYLRSIPYLVANIALRLVMRGVKKPSERISRLFNEISAGTNVKGLKVYEYEHGKTKNAIASRSGVYLGSELIKTLTDDEIKAVIAHEISHHKTRDLPIGYIFAAPYFGALALAGGKVAEAILSSAPYWSSWVGIDSNIAQTLNPVPGQSLSLTFAAAAAAGVYGLYSHAAYSYGSRVLEYRADRNAVKMTQNPEALISMLTKLGLDLSQNRVKEAFSSHPSYIKRVTAIMREGGMKGDFKIDHTSRSVRGMTDP